MFKIDGLSKNKIYKMSLRASDSAVPEHTDQNQKITVIGNNNLQNKLIDGYFGDREELIN